MSEKADAALIRQLTKEVDEMQSLERGCHTEVTLSVGKWRRILQLARAGARPPVPRSTAAEPGVRVEPPARYDRTRVIGGPGRSTEEGTPDACPKCGNSTSPEAGSTWKRDDGTCYVCEERRAVEPPADTQAVTAALDYIDDHVIALKTEDRALAHAAAQRAARKDGASG